MKSKKSDITIESFTPSRLRIDLRSGSLVRHADGVYRITEVLDFNSAVAIHVETGRARVLRIGELLSVETIPAVASDVDIDSIAEEDWRVASDRFSKIRPLLEMRARYVRTHSIASNVIAQSRSM